MIIYTQQCLNQIILFKIENLYYELKFEFFPIHLDRREPSPWINNYLTGLQSSESHCKNLLENCYKNNNHRENANVRHNINIYWIPIILISIDIKNCFEQIIYGIIWTRIHCFNNELYEKHKYLLIMMNLRKLKLDLIEREITLRVIILWSWEFVIRNYMIYINSMIRSNLINNDEGRRIDQIVVWTWIDSLIKNYYHFQFNQIFLYSYQVHNSRIIHCYIVVIWFWCANWWLIKCSQFSIIINFIFNAEI